MLCCITYWTHDSGIQFAMHSKDVSKSTDFGSSRDRRKSTWCRWLLRKRMVISSTLLPSLLHLHLVNTKRANWKNCLPCFAGLEVFSGDKSRKRPLSFRVCKRNIWHGDTVPLRERVGCAAINYLSGSRVTLREHLFETKTAELSLPSSSSSAAVGGTSEPPKVTIDLPEGVKV